MNKQTKILNENITHRIEITENKSKKNFHWCILEIVQMGKNSFHQIAIAQGEEFSLDDCFKEIKHAKLSLN